MKYFSRRARFFYSQSTSSLLDCSFWRLKSPNKVSQMENESKQIAYWRPIQGVRKCEKVWTQVRTINMNKYVPCRSPRSCPPYFLFITAFNYLLTTSYYLLLLLTLFKILCTTCLLLLYYSVTIVFASFNVLLLYFYYFFTTCLLLFTMLILLLYYRFTTWYYMFTTSLLHVCYFSRLNYILLFVDTLPLLLVTF